MDWSGLAAWIPTAAVAAMAVIGCAAAYFLPERARRRHYGLLAVALCGAVAVAATVWQQRREARMLQAGQAETGARHQAADAEAGEKLARRLHVAWQLFAAASRQLPAAPGAPPPPASDTVDAGFAALAAEADELEKRVAAFRSDARGRALDDATAKGLIDYLRPRGPHRVVVSCVPADEEAYLYANRIATILREAGWDAVGPEPTAMFGTAPAMGISLYARAGEPPEAAHVLVDAFTRFNIPYQSRIAASDAIPDTDTLELFVGKKP